MALITTVPQFEIQTNLLNLISFLRPVYYLPIAKIFLNVKRPGKLTIGICSFLNFGIMTKTYHFKKMSQSKWLLFSSLFFLPMVILTGILTFEPF